MNRLTRVFIAVTGSLLCSLPLRAENWAQWRGPQLNGSSPETNLPDKLDPKENLIWSTELPGPSCATPVTFGERIFVSSVDKTTQKLLALGVNRADGKILWSKPVGDSRHNERNDLASPSPITDGKTVWFYYGSGDLAAFNLEGKPLWARNLQKDFGDFHYQWLYGASGLLYGGKLYVPVLHRDRAVGSREAPAKPAESYLLCVDPATGKDIWRIVRPTDAVSESQEAYTTPITIEVNGRMQIVIVGGDHVTGHDADTGKELWRTPTYNPTKVASWRTVTSGTAGAGLIFASGPKGSPLFAVQPNGGESPDAPLAWTNPKVSTDVCAPLFYQGHVYVLNGDGKKTLYCLDPKSGEIQWAAELGGKQVIRTSPTGADGKIYCMNEAGDVWVVSAADGKVLDKQSLGTESPARSSIVVSDGWIFIRTADHLYAFGKKK
jgi:outer membrane protein assembly factor BamB